jgi:hypothetical protein
MGYAPPEVTPGRTYCGTRCSMSRIRNRQIEVRKSNCRVPTGDEAPATEIKTKSRPTKEPAGYVVKTGQSSHRVEIQSNLHSGGQQTQLGSAGTEAISGCRNAESVDAKSVEEMASGYRSHVAFNCSEGVGCIVGRHSDSDRWRSFLWHEPMWHAPSVRLLTTAGAA